MRPSVRNRRLGMVSPRRGLGKQSRRIPSDGGQGVYKPFFNTLWVSKFDAPGRTAIISSLEGRPSGAKGFRRSPLCASGGGTC